MTPATSLPTADMERILAARPLRLLMGSCGRTGGACSLYDVATATAQKSNEASALIRMGPTIQNYPAGRVSGLPRESVSRRAQPRHASSSARAPLVTPRFRR